MNKRTVELFDIQQEKAYQVNKKLAKHLVGLYPSRFKYCSIYDLLQTEKEITMPFQMPKPIDPLADGIYELIVMSSESKQSEKYGQMQEVIKCLVTGQTLPSGDPRTMPIYISHNAPTHVEEGLQLGFLKLDANTQEVSVVAGAKLQVVIVDGKKKALLPPK